MNVFWYYLASKFGLNYLLLTFNFGQWNIMVVMIIIDGTAGEGSIVFVYINSIIIFGKE